MTDLYLYLVHKPTGAMFKLAKGVNGLRVPQIHDGYPGALEDSGAALILGLDAFFKECGYPDYGDYAVKFVNELKDAPAEEPAPLALTDQHSAALERAIVAEGYSVLVDPDTGDVKLERTAPRRSGFLVVRGYAYEGYTLEEAFDSMHEAMASVRAFQKPSPLGHDELVI